MNLLDGYSTARKWLSVVVFILFIFFMLSPDLFETCTQPLAYSIGSIDEQYGLSKTSLRTALSEAEKMWEDAVGIELFRYDPSANFDINIIYSDLMEDVAELDEYNTDIDDYNIKVDDYENRLEIYNDTVDYWNARGGAPNNIYNQLLDESDVLDSLYSSLDNTLDNLNGVGDSLDTEWDNETQGEYTYEGIEVYAFVDSDDLVVTLAHELGHHYIEDHSNQIESVMYYTEGVDPELMKVTNQDTLFIKLNYSFCTN